MSKFILFLTLNFLVLNVYAFPSLISRVSINGESALEFDAIRDDVDVVIQKLSQQYDNDSVRTINFSRVNQVTDDCAKNLVIHYLERLRNLEELDFTLNRITDDGIIHFKDLLLKPHFSYLVLVGNSIGMEGIGKVLTALQQHFMDELRKQYKGDIFDTTPAIDQTVNCIKKIIWIPKEHLNSIRLSETYLKAHQEYYRTHY